MNNYTFEKRDKQNMGKFQSSLDSVAQMFVMDALQHIFIDCETRITSPIPSITNYLYKVEVEEECYVAKLSILGLSKATAARRYADKGIEKLIDEQRGYTNSLDNNIRRESEQIRFLASRFPDNLPELVGYSCGVMVEKEMDLRYRLQEGLASSDVELGPLFDEAYKVMNRIHSLSKEDKTVVWIASQFSTEKTQTDTLLKFKRKFLTNDGIFDYIALLGQDINKDESRFISETYRFLSGVISKLIDEYQLNKRQCVVYGDFKPENILISNNGHIVLVDGETHMGRKSLDIGRMISRTSLCFLYDSIALERKKDIAYTIKEFAGLARADLDATRLRHLERETILIIAMDLLNILSSYLSLDPAQIKQYPNNVQENYRGRLKILDKVEKIFNPKKGKQEIVSLDELIDHFRVN